MPHGLLTRALGSVLAQTRQPDAILIHNDKEGLGAGRARQRLLAQVQTEWTIWLDSDDEWYPHHLQALWEVAQATGSVWVYSWFDGGDPLGHFGLPYDPCRPHHTTMGILERTDLAREAGFPESATDWPVSNEDLSHIFRFAEICCQRGLKMTHLPERTWIYHQHGQNSSGLPHKGDATYRSIGY